MACPFEFTLDPKVLGERVEKKTLLESYSLETLCSELKTSLTDGLCSDPNVISARKRYFGENYIPPKMPHNFFYYFFKACQDHMLIFLFVGGIIVFIAEMIRKPKSGGLDGIAIIISVLIIVTVTSVNDYTKELKFKNLHKSIKLGNTCTVIRDRQVCEINTVELVVGDIYLPQYGDQVPADSIIFQANGIRVEESALTGESELVKKDPVNQPYLLSSTYIMDGSGKALVVAVGYNSQTGRILKLLGAVKEKKQKKKKSEKSESEDTPNQKCRSILQEKLTKLALLIGKLGVAAGITVFLIQLIRFCVNNYTGQEARGFVTNDLFKIFDFLLQGFTVVVVAVPEGLPLAVTLSLAYSVVRMLRDKNLVRQLYSCETMGNATTICSDKTGTLTTNRMTVIQMYTDEIKIDDFSTRLSLSAAQTQRMVMNICLNKSPSSTLKPPDVPGAPPLQLGNKTDCALLGLLPSLGVSFDEFTSSFSPDRIIKIYPFNSEKKMMSIVYDLNNGTYMVLVKGAPDVLLQRCSMQYNKTGQHFELDNKGLSELRGVVGEMALESLRTIVMASKEINSQEFYEEIAESDLTSHLTFLALVGIEDPVRPDVPEAIRLCKRAGITVRMVTGDNITTARSIALKCGILGSEPDELILDSTKFNSLIQRNGNFDQELFDRVWPKLKVLARSTPKDKYVLVNGILNTKLKQQIVAVTGDGTNDAPALKRADVGFAMGLTGTDIAKEACDIIITDDNFSNIVNAILWGRNVYDCITKFLIFQLTVNCVAILISIILSIFWDNVFHSTQMLWVNIVMDSFASLALATEMPTKDLLNRKPYPRNKSLISKYMMVFICLHSLYQLAVLIILVLFSSRLFSIEDNFELNRIRQLNGEEAVDTQHSTLLFNVFVIMQIFNEINARKVHGERNVFENIHKSKIFLLIFFLTCFVQVIIIQFTYGFFHVVPLSAELWLWSIFIGSTVLLYHQLVVIFVAKIIPVPKRFRIKEGISSAVVLSEEPRPFDPQLVWIRGLKKLQTQLRVINAFKENLTVTSVISTPSFMDENKFSHPV